MNRIIKLFFAVLILCAGERTFAQRDSSRQQAINITSAFKPVLRNAVKINLTASQLPADSSRPRLTYKIPAQNLFYAYRPISLRPLALQQDSSLYLGNRNFVKAGFGNYQTPYISAGVSFGDGKTGLFNLTGDYIQSKGKIKNQDYSLLNLRADGSYFFGKNELSGGAEISSHQYHLYGYDHAALNFSKNAVEQQLQNVSVFAALKNTAANDIGINYDLNLKAGFFSNRNRAKETNLFVDFKADKSFTKEFGFVAEVKAELTDYNTQDRNPKISLKNNLVHLMPGIAVSLDALKLHGGIAAVYDKDRFDLLPDVYAEFQLPQQSFAFQAGWIGRYMHNNYKNLTDINPYLTAVNSQWNTKETEYYGGVKASFAKHFNFSAKAGLVNYHDLPFFINDTATDNKAFLISNESRVNNFRIHGDISYLNQDKFSFTGSVTINGYTGMRDNKKAWHTLPVEVKSSLRWYAYKSVLIKGDLYAFAGSNYLIKGNDSRVLHGGTDVSAGLEVKINKTFSVWADGNNLLNDKYERWHNYPVYGTNFIAGVIARF